MNREDIEAIKNRLERLKCFPVHGVAGICAYQDIPDLLAEVARLSDLSKRCTETSLRCSQENAKLRRVVKAARNSYEACLCTRDTFGFDYHEKHKRLGNPEQGARWLTPRDMLGEALAALDEEEIHTRPPESIL